MCASLLRVNRSLIGPADLFTHSHEGGGGSSIDEDVVFLKFLDVSLELVHLGLKGLLAALFANRVQFAVMGLFLVVSHGLLPFLLKGSDKFLTLLLGHEHSLLVSSVLLLDLHLTDEVVLILDLLLDLGDVLGDSAVGLLLEHVLLLARWQFWSCEDVLDSVGDNKVLIRNKAVDWLLVTLGDSLFRGDVTCNLTDLFLGDEDWLTGASLSEGGLVGSESALGSSHGGTTGLVRVSSSLKVKLAGKIGTDGLRGRS